MRIKSNPYLLDYYKEKNYYGNEKLKTYTELYDEEKYNENSTEFGSLCNTTYRLWEF